MNRSSRSLLLVVGLQVSGADEAERLSRTDKQLAEEQAGVELTCVTSPWALVAGTVPQEFLQETLEGIDAGRRWFHSVFSLAEDDAFVGDRLPQFYLFDNDSQPYLATCEWFAGLSPTVGPDWAAVVQGLHGFFWWDPYPLSSARRWNRPLNDLKGRCFHHAGHLWLNRLGYDGRLLPPWFEESFAALMEHRAQGRNGTYCVPSTPSGGATQSAGGARIKTDDFVKGGWRRGLRAALQDGGVPSFDVMSQRDYGALELLDIAAGMAMLEWMLEQDGALPRFHAALRAAAPPAPARLIEAGGERQAAHDRAFQAAVQSDWKTVDEAWRTWFLKNH